MEEIHPWEKLGSGEGVFWPSFDFCIIGTQIWPLARVTGTVTKFPMSQLLDSILN